MRACRDWQTGDMDQSFRGEIVGTTGLMRDRIELLGRRGRARQPHVSERFPRVRMLALKLAVTFVLAAALACRAQNPSTNPWRTATPESQGLDSGVLADMLDHIRSRSLPIHSLLLIRHGHLVLEASFFPYESGTPHDIASATKSVTSLLIGIAVDKGYLKDVSQAVLALLPGAAPATVESRKQSLTIEHLLTMTSGLDCGFEAGEKELAAMRRTEDWAAFALALPMRAAPGAQFAYCSCNNHLLSSILSAQTGESALAFARKHLFGPLGINDVIWPADPRGRTHGWGDLHLLPRDLAKIAYLYLQGGRWNGKQIVSEAWVRRSTTPIVKVRDGVGYGYSWWINTTRQPPVFEAEGRGGQRAAVVADKDIVVVFNGGGVNTDEIAPFLFRAIRSDGPLPETTNSTVRLATALKAAQQPPEAQSIPTLPLTAQSISGKRYVVDPNPLGLQAISLLFKAGTDARATLEIDGQKWSVPVGLDGRPGFSSTGPFGLPIAAAGRWLSEREFLLDVDTVANINHFLIRMDFVGNQLHLTVDEVTGELKGLAVLGRLDPAVR
jgi:CubicO group peptidase (beta-lactamase class C family)